MKNLPFRLRKLRGGLTQTELAKKADVPQSAISEIEAGERNPMTDTLQKIAKALGFSVADLLDDTQAATHDQTGTG